MPKPPDCIQIEALPVADLTGAQLVDHVRAQGHQGVGQTSWGPTLFVLTKNVAAAENLVADLASESRWNDCRFHIAAPMNTGAVIEAR